MTAPRDPWRDGDVGWSLIAEAEVLWAAVVEAAAHGRLPEAMSALTDEDVRRMVAGRAAHDAFRDALGDDG